MYTLFNLPQIWTGKAKVTCHSNNVINTKYMLPKLKEKCIADVQEDPQLQNKASNDTKRQSKQTMTDSSEGTFHLHNGEPVGELRKNT